MRIPWFFPRIILSVLLLFIMVGSTSLAQEEATGEPTAPPTEVSTELPTEAPTAVPTELPTELASEPPTVEATEVVTEPPTFVPTLVEVTAEATPPAELTAEVTLETLLAPAPLVARVEPVTEASLMAAQVFVVNSEGDADDANYPTGPWDVVCDTNLAMAGNQCSLRAALQQANASIEKDTINFNISPGVKVLHTIIPTSGPLPPISAPVIINGMSESGYTWATPQIEVYGFAVGAGNAGLELAGGSDGSTIKGLVIDGGWDYGIRVVSANNLIQANFIGVQAAGTVADGNIHGIRTSSFGATNNTIGGTTAALRNVISGNFYGVYLEVGSSNTRVVGNYIGANKTGTLGIAGSGTGVLLNAANDNTIGGATAGTRNVISGNTFEGVYLFNGAAFNRVAGNYIGTKATGTGVLANGTHGVLIEGSDNIVGGAYPQAGNRIANNVGDGIHVASGTRNRLLTNWIYNNGELGIDLFHPADTPPGVTLNDPLDGDPGANNLQNYPLLERATGTRYFGSLPSAPNRYFRLQFFASPTCDGVYPDYFGEGQRYLGTAVVLTDSLGGADFNLLLPVAAPTGWAVTATATEDIPVGPLVSYFNTSEFSNCVKANLGAPVLLSPANNAIVGTDTPLFDWRAVAGADEYLILISRYPTFPPTQTTGDVVPAPTTSYSALALERSESYYWRVAARAYGQNGPWSATWRINVAP